MRAADDPKRFEHPRDFNLDSAWLKFDMLLAASEAFFGKSLDHDKKGAVQDASYLAEIFLPFQAYDQTGLPQDAAPSIIVSKWANLSTVTFDRAFQMEILTVLVSIIEGAGYTYVPERLLFLTYPGPNKEVSSGPSWFGRYFSYH